MLLNIVENSKLHIVHYLIISVTFILVRQKTTRPGREKINILPIKQSSLLYYCISIDQEVGIKTTMKKKTNLNLDLQHKLKKRIRIHTFRKIKLMMKPKCCAWWRQIYMIYFLVESREKKQHSDYHKIERTHFQKMWISYDTKRTEMKYDQKYIYVCIMYIQFGMSIANGRHKSSHVMP